MTTIGVVWSVVKRQQLVYPDGMEKDEALKLVRRTAKAREKARTDFIEALRAAEPVASWAEIAKAAGDVDRASLYKLLRRAE